jgi:hypothetical protein
VALLGVGAVVLVTLISVPSLAQPGDAGARAIALAGAGVAAGADAWAEANPAGWATVVRRTAGLTASQAYGLPELRTVAARVVVPTAAATLAAAIRSYGFSDYRELRASLGAARTVPVAAGRRMALGARLDYHSVAVAGFANRGAFDVAVGAQVDVTPAASAGVAIRNALAIARPDSAELRMPHALNPVLAVGVLLRPASSATLALDVEKDVDYPPLARLGLQFAPVPAATLRLGAAAPLAGTGGARLAFGAGFETGGLVVDAAVDWHVLLGPSPAVGVTARF